MSNLQVQFEDNMYNGIAIKFVDGLVVSADGQMIRHGTTSSDFDGNQFGVQFAANGILMTSVTEEKKW